MLRQRPQHGYEIKKSIEQVLGGTVSLNNKILYPALKHFEEMGAVVREVVQQEGKPNRHIYQLTERGIELLQAYLSDFPPEHAGNEAGAAHGINKRDVAAAFVGFVRVP